MAIVSYPNVRLSFHRDGCDCGASSDERCADTCARVKAYWSTRCGCRPERGQKLVGENGVFVIASGNERCSVAAGHGDAQAHRWDNDFRAFRWTDTPEFVRCAICGNDIMAHGAVGLRAIAVLDKHGSRRDGPVHDACEERVRGVDLEWRGDRLAPKGAADREVGGSVAIAIGEFFARVSRWAATCEGQEAVRDYAVAKAVADAPAGCDAQRWRNVVHVIAADAHDEAPRLGGCSHEWVRIWMRTGIANVRATISHYARLRQTKTTATAVREALATDGCDGRCPWLERLFAAYEAG